VNGETVSDKNSVHAELVEAQKNLDKTLSTHVKKKRGAGGRNRRPLTCYLVHKTTATSPGDGAEDWSITNRSAHHPNGLTKQSHDVLLHCV